MTHAIRDDVRVAVKTSFWVSVILIISGQVPNDQSLVAAAREEHVRVLEAGC